MAIIKVHFPETDLPLDLDCNDDRFFWAWQAINLQSWLEADRDHRRIGMLDWSKAVRNGFVCC